MEERTSGLMVAGSAQNEALPPQLSLTILLPTRYRYFTSRIGISGANLKMTYWWSPDVSLHYYVTHTVPGFSFPAEMWRTGATGSVAEPFEHDNRCTVQATPRLRHVGSGTSEQTQLILVPPMHL